MFGTLGKNRRDPLIEKVQRDYAEGRLPRRDFLRFATLLGASAPMAYAFANKVDGGSFVGTAHAQDLPRGGTLRWGMRVMAVRDAHALNWVQAGMVATTVCPQLTRTGADNVTRPYLLEGWDASEDLRTWDLRIREGVTWRKGGTLTAEQVKWNFEHWLNPATGSSALGLMGGYLLTDVETGETDEDGNPVTRSELWDANALEIVDDRTLRLNLKAPTITIPEDLFFYNCGILDPAENGILEVGGNGCGAFDLVELEVSNRAVFRRRDDFWGEGPFLDEMQFIDLGDDPSASISAIASDQIDGVYQIDASLIPTVEGLPNTVIHETNSAATAIVQMRVTDEPFDDPRVRQAIRWATDSNEALSLAVQGRGLPGEHHFVCPVHPEYAPLPEMTRDPAKARALLADAGYPDGIDIEMYCKSDPAWELSAVQVLQQQYEEAGIRMRINNIPSASFWDQWDKVPLAFVEWAHRPLGITILALGFRSGVPWNAPNYANPELDALISQAEGTLDVEERRSVMAEIERLMQDDGPIAQPIWRSVFTATHPRVAGYTLHPMYFVFADEVAVSA